MGGGLFMPEEKVTNAQAIKMLVSVLGYGAYADSLGSWPQGYIKCGELLGIKTDKPADDYAVWEDVAKMLEAAYTAPHLCVSEFSADGKLKFYTNGNITFDKMNAVEE